MNRWKHLNAFYTLISIHEYHLNTFSVEGSIHDLLWNGVPIQCEFQFSGQPESVPEATYAGYGGPIVIYRGDDEKYWMRPTYEFLDGRFERVIE